MASVQGFDSVGMTLEIDKFNFKDSRFIHLDDGANLAFVQVECRQILGEGDDI